MSDCFTDLEPEILVHEKVHALKRQLPPDTPNDELYRVKALKIPLRHVLNYYFGQKGLPSVIEVSEPILPEGYKVYTCQVDHLRLCLLVLIWHPSFDVVKEGDVPPYLDAEAKNVRYALATKEDLARRAETVGQKIRKKVVEEMGPAFDPKRYHHLFEERRKNVPNPGEAIIDGPTYVGGEADECIIMMEGITPARQLD